MGHVAEIEGSFQKMTIGWRARKCGHVSRALLRDKELVRVLLQKSRAFACLFFWKLRPFPGSCGRLYGSLAEIKAFVWRGRDCGIHRCACMVLEASCMCCSVLQCVAVCCKELVYVFSPEVKGFLVQVFCGNQQSETKSEKSEKKGEKSEKKSEEKREK